VVCSPDPKDCARWLRSRMGAALARKGGQPGQCLPEECRLRRTEAGTLR